MPNIQPIFSRVSDIQGALLITAAADYIGQNVFNSVVFQADPTNGGYVQKLRFKAWGGNIATVARVYITTANGINAPSSNVPQSPTGTAGSGGNLLTSNIVFKVASVDQWGAPSGWSAESANIAVTGPTGNVQLNWNASSNSNSYIVAVGKTPGSEERAFMVTGANTYNMISIPANNISTFGWANTANIYTSGLFGECSLPAVTGIQTTGTVDIDYPMNLALPPGYKIIVGLGTTVANGWFCTAIAGKY